jgi:hypothetical protein
MKGWNESRRATESDPQPCLLLKLQSLKAGKKEKIIILIFKAYLIYRYLPYKMAVLWIRIRSNRHRFTGSVSFSTICEVSVLYLTLLHLPLLRFHCVGECWDRTQDSCDFGIGCQTL